MFNLIFHCLFLFDSIIIYIKLIVIIDVILYYLMQITIYLFILDTFIDFLTVLIFSITI
jgi:hypothetical protein